VCSLHAVSCYDQLPKETKRADEMLSLAQRGWKRGAWGWGGGGGGERATLHDVELHDLAQQHEKEGESRDPRDRGHILARLQCTHQIIQTK
jgi:hypothetical protein